MSFGFGFGFTKITAAIRAAFSPSSLFAANEPGVWYDPSDFSTLYQDAAGTTPVTAVEQPVGLMLDKSKGLVLGPELVVNGGFDADLSGWTTSAWVYRAGNAYLNTGTAYQSITQTAPMVVGRSYRISYNYQVVSGSIQMVFNSQSTPDTVKGVGTGTSSFIFTLADARAAQFAIRNIIAATEAYIDNISVRELPGNHAYQTTATSRPVLSARYNLLTKTEQFDDAAWGKTAVSLDATLVTAPNGTLTAYKATTSSDPRLTQNFTAQAVPYRFSVYLRSTSGTFRVPIAIVGGDGSTVGASFSVMVTTQWQQFSVSATAVAGANARVQIFSVATPVGTVVEVWGADLRVANDGVNLPPYQRVNTATDYDTVGFPHYLRFDGVDDWLVTNTITPGIDKVQVFAGVRKLSDAVAGAAAELSANINSNNGAFYLFAPVSTSPSGDYAVASRGSVFSGSTTARYAVNAPNTSTVTLTADIAGDLVALRTNGVSRSSGTGDQGTGNYLAYPLYIGRRGGTANPFNGHLYSLIVRFGSNLPIGTIEKTEKYINTKTGAY